MTLPPGWPTIADLRTLREVEAGGSATAAGLLRAALAGDLDLYLLPDFQEWDLNEVHVYSSPPARDEQPSHVVETLDLDFPAPLDRTTISSLLGSGTAVVRTVRSPWGPGYLGARLKPPQLEAGGATVSRADLARYLADRGAQGDFWGVNPMVEAPAVLSESNPPSQADLARDLGGQDAQGDSRGADPMVETPAALDETDPRSPKKVAAEGRRAARLWVAVGAVALLAAKPNWAKVGDHTIEDLKDLAGRLAGPKHGRTAEQWMETILVGEWALAVYRGHLATAHSGSHDAEAFEVLKLADGTDVHLFRVDQERRVGALALRLEVDPGPLLHDLMACARRISSSRSHTKVWLWDHIEALLRARVVAYGVLGAKAHTSGTVREWVFGRGGRARAEGVRTRAR